MAKGTVFQTILDSIHPNKDADGFHPLNVGKLSIASHNDENLLIPCTPYGCLIMLKGLGVDLSGKNAIVIGRSNIVGKPMAQLLIKESCTVTIAHSRTNNIDFTKKLKVLEEKYNVRIRNINFDILDSESMKIEVYKIFKEKIPVDILVNSAGIIHGGLFQMSPIKDIRKVFDVNFFSPYLLTQTLLKKMIKNKRSSIINISSSAARDCPPGRVAYSAAKSSLEKFSETLSKEYGSFNVRSNIISPGLVSTDMLKFSMKENEIDTIIEITVKG